MTHPLGRNADNYAVANDTTAEDAPADRGTDGGNDMHHKAITKPRWTLADREVDATDCYYETTGDDENICTAFLNFDNDTGFATLIGIGITDLDCTEYFDRLEAMEKHLLTPSALWRIEQHEMQARDEEPTWGAVYDRHREEYLAGAE